MMIEVSHMTTKSALMEKLDEYERELPRHIEEHKRTGTYTCDSDSLLTFITAKVAILECVLEGLQMPSGIKRNLSVDEVIDEMEKKTK